MYLFVVCNIYPVYEPKEDYFVNKLRTLPLFHDKEYAESHFADDEKDFLVMPYVFCTKQCYRVNNELKF